MPGESNIGATSTFHFNSASTTSVGVDGSSTSTIVTSLRSTYDSFTSGAGLPRLPGADSHDEEPRIASNNRSQNNNPLTRGIFGGLLGGGAGCGLAAIFGANPLAMLIIGLLLFALILGLMHGGGIHNHGREDAHEHSESVRGHIIQPPAEGHTPVTPPPAEGHTPVTPPPAVTPPVNEDEFTLPIHEPTVPPLQAPLRSRL